MEYSIVVPVYNSSNTLELLFKQIATAMENYDYEIIFVNDGSMDESWQKLIEIKRSASKKITLINLAKNFGQQNATLCGLNHSTGQHAITLDDDLQIQPKEILKLISHSKDTSADIVYGIYKDQQQSKHRTILKKIAFYFLKKFNPTIGKTSSCRILNKKLIDKLRTQHTHFINIDEILQWYTNSISTVEVEHQSRQNGNSGYSIFSLIKISVSILLNYYSFPLQFITSIGFYTSIFSIGLGSFYIIKKIFFNVSIEGWTSLMVVLLFSTGIIVFSLGIIGKYLLQIINAERGKPTYIVSEIKE